MQPNILLIMTDQHHPGVLGAAGHPRVHTPNLDALASESVRFTDAYCPSPVCAPSRASLMTGMYPPGHGVVVNQMQHQAGQPTLADRLGQEDYQTAMVGKLHLFPAGSRHGFSYFRSCDSPYGVYNEDEVRYNAYRRWIEDQCFGGDYLAAERAASESEWHPVSDPVFWLGHSWIDQAHHMTRWVGDESCAFIRERDDRQPFFLQASFFGPHHPYRSCEPWDSRHDPDSIELPPTLRGSTPGPVFDHVHDRRRKLVADWSDDTWRQMIAAYYGQVEFIDQEIGRICQSLRDRGQWDNTMIVFTADHGDHLGEMGFIGKGTMYEGSAKVPLIIKPPANPVPGLCRTPVTTLDLFGTMLEVAGEPRWQRDRREGRVEAGSLLPLLNEPDAKGQAANHGGDEREQVSPSPVFSVIRQDPEESLTMCRVDQYKLIRLGRGDQPPVYEMYDVSRTDEKAPNLYNDPNHASRAGELKSRLDQWVAHQSKHWPAPAIRERSRCVLGIDKARVFPDASG